MSLWQFSAAVGGWIKANTTKADTLTREEADTLADLVDKA